MRYYALAENHRPYPEKGHVEARVVHSFGRADKLTGRCSSGCVSIRRVLGEESGGPAVEGCSADGSRSRQFSELGVIHVVSQGAVGQRQY
ncbi:MAG: hypothetical protein R3D03_21270 [Geminicoccaceae bacterium]